MKNIIAMSLEKCFRYVTDDENSGYVLISIQADVKGGFGVSFNATDRCKDVLELKFDDVEGNEPGTHFSDEQAKQIISFVKKHINTDTLVVHCYAGISRSQAVKHALIKCLGLEEEALPWLMNQYVYDTIIRVWDQA